MVSNDGALRIPHVPDHLVIVGAGVIGLELGSVWRRLGSRVTVLELAPSILPGFDADVIKEADKIFRQQGTRSAHRGPRNGRSRNRRSRNRHGLER